MLYTQADDGRIEIKGYVDSRMGIPLSKHAKNTLNLHLHYRYQLFDHKNDMQFWGAEVECHAV